MKEYETESQAAAKWKIDHKTWRKLINITINHLNELFLHPK